MILVTLGTQDKPFTRLLEAIDKMIEKKKIQDKVVVQAGFTNFKSDNMEIFDYIDRDSFEKLIDECDVLITHGGVGAILAGVMKNKKVIAAARLSKYKEHVNDHQLQIITQFVESGYILELKDFNKLDKMLKKACKFVPRSFDTGTHNMINLLENYIDKL